MSTGPGGTSCLRQRKLLATSDVGVGGRGMAAKVALATLRPPVPCGGALHGSRRRWFWAPRPTARPSSTAAASWVQQAGLEADEAGDGQEETYPALAAPKQTATAETRAGSS